MRRAMPDAARCAPTGLSMADVLPVIEAMENRWMRAWVAGDAKTLKSLTSSKFRLVIASRPSVLLDARSWLAAATSRFCCNSYRYGDVYSRRVSSVIVFATRMEMKATLDGEDWSGQVWVTDLWKKSAVRRKWVMVERHLSRPEESAQLPRLVQSLQLWR